MDILGLGLPITKTPYFEGGTVTPAEIAGGADIWFDATKRENVTENGGRASSVRNSGSESSQPNPGVVDWVLSYVGTEATYEQVGGQNDLPFLKFTGIRAVGSDRPRDRSPRPALSPRAPRVLSRSVAR